MAEKVHKRLELMLPELEELESTGVFSREEIRAIVQRRRSLEYRLLRRPSQKEDFLGAIQYEINLELLCRHRRKARGVISSRNDSAYGIQSRIHSLFRRALSKFKGDLKMWLQYIEFCKRCHHDNTLSKLYGQVLSIHPRNSSLWVMAAKFEFETMKNASSSRALLQQGIRANPESKHLWMELFRMELLYVEKMKKRRDLLGLEDPVDEKTGNMSDDFLAYKTASVVYRQAVKAIPADIDFRLQFLPICQLFEGTEQRQQEIYDNVREDFFTHPLYWDALARRPWAGQQAVQGCVYSDVIKLEAQSEATYEEGIKTVQNGDDLAKLWAKYSQWALERVKCSTHSMELETGATRRLLRVFRKALDTGHVTEDMFSCYIGTLLGLGLSEEAVQIGSKATERYPKSVPMWLLRLRTLDAVGGDQSMEAVMAVYEKAIHTVPKEEALPIWVGWIQRSVNLYTMQDNIEHIFQAALACGVPGIRDVLCVQYVDWVFISRGTKQARNVYKRLMETPPVPYALYLKCIAIETAGMDPSLKSLRDLFEKALRDYGMDHPDLWLKYMKAEMSHSEGEPENVGKLHWRAMKSLKPELTAVFIAQYSQLS
ncbi:hypothetical protein EMCRGX_G027613 [Ephydatia muelleri]